MIKNDSPHTPGQTQAISGNIESATTRSFNERTVIHTLRHMATASRAEVARATQLTAQTIAVITDRLMREGLVIEKGRKYGGLGQPSKQIALNPDGAYSVGVKVGLRSIDTVAINFTGDLIQERHDGVTFPNRENAFEIVTNSLHEIRRGLGERWDRVTGIGIATPFNLGAWSHQLGAPDDNGLDTWNHLDLGHHVREQFQRPTYVENDGSAATIAELVFGKGREFDSFFYVYLGTVLGGGIVINGRCFRGITSNAGDFGLMPVVDAQGDPKLLMRYASHATLINFLADQGHTVTTTTQLGHLYKTAPEIFDDWLDSAARALVTPLLSVICLLDTQALVFGGRLPRPLTEALVHRIGQRISNAADKHQRLPVCCVGEINDNAPSFGGAMLPFYAEFTPDTEQPVKAPG